MSEMLAEVPPEYRQPVAPAELPDYGTPEFGAELEPGFGFTEKAVADVAIEGSGLVEVPAPNTTGNFGEQLSIENEPGIQWPTAEAEIGSLSNAAPESNYAHPQDMSPLEEAKYTSDYITRAKAHEEWTSGKIDWAEFDKRVSGKNARTYQQPLLRQNGQLFEQEKPVLDNPNIGVGEEDGTFWHGSNQLMKPGEWVLPSAEVPDAVHETNKSDRSFTSSSAPNGSSHEAEQDFAFGYPREAGYLPTPYGKHIYKVSSPNSDIVPTSNGPEVWAEGGARVEKLMHPDFARNYNEARHRANNDNFQPGLPGMENGMQFVPEAELDVPSQEFYDKHLKAESEAAYQRASKPKPGPEDVELPGFEEYGKRPVASISNSEVPQV